MSVSAMQLYFSQYKSPMETRGPMNFIMPDDPLRPRVSKEAEDIYRKHRQGTGVANILGGGLADNWVPVHNPASINKRKKKPKNFIGENKANVKKVEENVQSLQKELEQKQREELAKPLWKSEKYDGVHSKIAEFIKRDNVSNNSDLALPVNTGRSKSVEPGNLNEVNNRPSNAVAKGIPVDPEVGVKGAMIQQENVNHAKGRIVDPSRPSSSIKKRSTSAKRSSSAQRQESKNFLRINLNSAGKGSEKRSQSAIALDKLHKKRDEDFHRHKPGEIPSYLRERKLAWQKNNEKKPQSDCPPGHVIMPAEEKQRTLDKLKSAEQDILSKLNHLPVRTDTTFLVRKKGEYQRRLDEVEEAIRIFSKPRVFVRQDVPDSKK